MTIRVNETFSLEIETKMKISSMKQNILHTFTLHLIFLLNTKWLVRSVWATEEWVQPGANLEQVVQKEKCITNKEN